jgi:DNA helicase-4
MELIVAFCVLALVVIVVAISQSTAPESRRAKEVSDQRLHTILEWTRRFELAAKASLADYRWLDRDFRHTWTSQKPPALGPSEKNLKHYLRSHNITERELQRLLDVVQQGVDAVCDKLNENFTLRELEECSAFFATVEKSPLTNEQARAVICMDNWVQVVAAAGSGKTSVMVAKAAYALHRHLVAPDRILLLAFNKGAADELQQRIDLNLKRAGFDADAVKASTLHAFGLALIGLATGKKPRLAKFAEDANRLSHSHTIVETLSSADSTFAENWALLKTVYARDLPAWDEDPVDEYWDPATRAKGFRTLDDTVVKSREEQMICDWLFMHGVRYEYERDYEIDLGDSTHGLYRPDFYYPDAQLYHEHFALDENGKPPERFLNYDKGVEWKRDAHRTHKTSLFETTSAGIRGSTPFAQLRRELESRGISVVFSPDRTAVGRKPIENSEILMKLLTFLTHYKSSRLDERTLRERLQSEQSFNNYPRHRTFIDVFLAFFTQWQQELKDSQSVDFDDMLGLAADLLADKNAPQDYDLVLVDEFQDTSIARLDLVRNLVAGTQAHVTAVGDDWQSINRFAGADISATTGFEKAVGKSSTLNLTRTFRCPDQISKISSEFAMKNPAQLTKSVTGQPNFLESHITIHFAASGNNREESAANRKAAIRLATEKILRGDGPGKESLIVLGRYNHELENRPDLSEFNGTFDYGYHTIHRSKGREADHIIVVGVDADDKFGFPSAIEDDFVLNLVMPGKESFAYAEERRLLYVAMTRAKKSVTLIADERTPSTFIRELIDDFDVPTLSVSGEPIESESCPQCGSTLVEKTNRGTGQAFWGCRSFPACGYSRPLHPTR